MPQDDDTRVGEAVEGMDEEDGDVPDLNAARGVVPAILLGVALWAIALGVAILLW